MPDLNFKENVLLAPFTTMKVGGAARYFVEVRTENEAIEAINWAKNRNLKIFILGGGSNVIISDAGFPGLVILNRIKGIEIKSQNGKIILKVGAGENWDDFVSYAVESGWQGVENLSGIPGTVGAAPVQNIGAYGQSVGDTILKVKAISIPDSRIKEFSNKECKFGYRTSIFRSEGYGCYFITSVTFLLKKNKDFSPVLSYSDLKKYFSSLGRQPTLREVRRAIIEIRAKKGMVILPGYESYFSVGSFFKNPLISRDEFERIRSIIKQNSFDGMSEMSWFWPQDDKIKVSAAKLIEESGFYRGYKEGNVGISPKHSLAIINYGKAKSRDILEFAKKIQNRVKEKFSVELEPEVELLEV